MSSRITLFLIAAVLAVVVVVWYGWGWLSAPRPVTPQQLAETAVSAPTPQQRIEAAAKLTAHKLTQIDSPVAIEEMSRVLHESTDSEVKAAMIQGLAAGRDFDSMDAFLAALDDESLLVRTRAHGAVKRLLQIDAGYRPEAPREQRLKKIKIYRDDWEKMRISPGLRKFREKLKQQAENGGGPG
jgi:hypothetical protein